MKGLVMNVAEILRKSADLIATHGWWNGGSAGYQQQSIRPDGDVSEYGDQGYSDTYCLYSAIGSACYPSVSDEAQAALRAYLDVDTNSEALRLNDSHPLTLESLQWAVDSLRGAADAWEAAQTVADELATQRAASD